MGFEQFYFEEEVLVANYILQILDLLAYNRLPIELNIEEISIRSDSKSNQKTSLPEI
jgi:hypothetical protein